MPGALWGARERLSRGLWSAQESSGVLRRAPGRFNTCPERAGDSGDVDSRANLRRVPRRAA
eukprot:15464015-Alexandrium_andersonii.AAC.1